MHERKLERVSTGGQLRRVELLSVSHSDFNSTPAQCWFDFDGSTWKENLDRDTRFINCMGRCPLLTRAYGYERTTMQQHCVWWALSGPQVPTITFTWQLEDEVSLSSPMLLMLLPSVNNTAQIRSGRSWKAASFFFIMKITLFDPPFNVRKVWSNIWPKLSSSRVGAVST